jgi:serine phosphatase RsbU (regulator of sigma subunit)/anti-sigma regulatory factor (Ser/Thr protein kinase)
MVRLINRRAADLFGLDPDQFRDGPVVQLQRTLARQTEDPEGFMETFQAVRDDPLLEIRTLVEQIIPTRRQMRLYSAPALDDRGQPVGRIEVFTDITEAMARSAEVRRLLDQARQVAESYQRSLLPTSTPALPRMSLVAHYVAAAGRRAVCGDFYDFVPLQNNRVGIVLGDVVGAGPAAANDAALTRYTLRSFAGELSSPERLLQWMNRHLNEQLEADRFVRLLLVSLDPERARLDYVNAGHVPPVLYRFATGQVEWLAEGGLVLGVEEDSVYKPAAVDLEPGDMLVLYTDGVTEAPRNGRPFGQAHLTDIVAKYGVGTPGEMIQAIRRSVDAWVEDGELRDDLSVIVCQVVPDELIGEPVRELVLPNDPARLAEMREFVAAYLAAVRAPVEPSSELLLAVGEATANATRHGRIDDRSEVRIRCSLDGPDAVVAVADDGTGFQPSEEDLAAPQDRFASGGRGMYLMKALADHIDVTGSRTGTTVTLHKRMWEQ